ncbi:MAG TPA: hypothetical protein VE861_14905 [Gemmatimonadaceae bacterium]|nr:hypothetical protein [Gemmatimonadaceae bacterium]
MSSFGNSSSRRQLAEMKQTLAISRVARDDVRTAYAATMQRLEKARAELETIVRRGDLARQIDDQETVAVAERFAESQRATVGVLERKAAVQHEELTMAERLVSEMEQELKAITGIGPSPNVAPEDHDQMGQPGADSADFRGLSDAARAQSADERLAELKRRMGRG